MDNKILIKQEVSLPYPLGVHKAFPLDSRSYFSNMEEAQVAVKDAVQLQRNENGNFILPSEEDGGADSVYYYGQPVVVAENDADTVGLYIVVKAYSSQNSPYGKLESVCSGLSSEYLKKDDANTLVNALINQYVEENMNTECIDDYLFTNAIDDCGNMLPTDGLYAFGLKEKNGVLEKCDSHKKVLSFDPNTLYDKNTNQIATLDSITNALNAFKIYVDEQLTHKVDKIPGYGLSQNDFNDYFKDKLETLPWISIQGNKLTINGNTYRLEEWTDIADYYVGWMQIRDRGDFFSATKSQLIAHSEAGFFTKSYAVFDGSYGNNNLFFLMTKEGVIFDEPVEISGLSDSSHLSSKTLVDGVEYGLESPIRTDISSIMHHAPILVNGTQYNVYGLHTYRPNTTDCVHVVFSRE